MTQPTAPSEGDNSLLILGTAATALALIAIESRVRQDVEDTINDALTVFAALLVAALATPTALIISGLAFMARADIHAALTKLTKVTREQVAATVQSGYAAAAAVAQQKAIRDLGSSTYTVPGTLPPLGDNIDRLDDDVDVMFGHAQADIQNSIITAYDTSTDPITRARNIRDAVHTAGGRLTQRALAAATTAVHTGAYDAQEAIYRDFQLHTGLPGLMKRWTVTSADPCGMCEALDGTLVGLSGEFDHQATTDDRDLRRVWRNLQGPPRHPNCRCTIELVQT